VSQKGLSVYTRPVPRYDVPKAAPHPLSVVQAFVNTVDLEHGREWLATPGDLERWFADNEIDATAGGRRGLRRAHDLREAFRTLLIANGHGEQPPGGAIQTVNEAARGLSTELTSDGEISFVDSRHGATTGLAQLVGIAFTSILDGQWPRLKACRNCRWAFFDYSRNRTAHWCSMTLCGNRQKTRRYRSRQKRRRAVRQEP
jgi:predicted RNA-binding Zn ribbon-like protein